jgi:DNA-binding MarR family transcriptional regulator
MARRVLPGAREFASGSGGLHETEREGEPGSLSQQAIGERLRTDRTTMVDLIDDLERAGYVRRERNPGDRRAYVITLTAAGKRAQARVEEAVDAHALEFFGKLSEEERQELHRLLARLIERPEYRRASSTCR